MKNYFKSVTESMVIFGKEYVKVWESGVEIEKIVSKKK